MTVSLEQLTSELPSDLKKRVEQTRNQFLQITQGELRRETGLLLNRNIDNLL